MKNKPKFKQQISIQTHTTVNESKNYQIVSPPHHQKKQRTNVRTQIFQLHPIETIFMQIWT